MQETLQFAWVEDELDDPFVDVSCAVEFGALNYVVTASLVLFYVPSHAVHAKGVPALLLTEVGVYVVANIAEDLPWLHLGTGHLVLLLSFQGVGEGVDPSADCKLRVFLS